MPLNVRVLASYRLVSLIVHDHVPVSIKLAFACFERFLVIIFNLHDLLQVAQLILIVLLGKFFISMHCNGQSAYGQMRRLEPQEVIFDQGDIEQVRSIDEHARLTHAYGSAVVLEEGLRGAAVDFEFDDGEDFALHGSHLRDVKRVLGHLDEIRHYRWVDLLELRGDEHSGDAEQLKLVQPDPLLAQVPIDDVDRDEERFGQQIELHLNYDQPVDQYLTLMRCDFPVELQVVAPWHEDVLYLCHPDVNFVAVNDVIVGGEQALVLVAQAADQMTFDGLGGGLRGSGLVMLLSRLMRLLLDYGLGRRSLVIGSADQGRLLR